MGHEWSLPVVCARPALTFTQNGSVRVPRFDDYPVPETWHGTAATPSLKSREERLFRTNLREAARKPPNFAGHYRFTIWGCGTRCAGGAIIDLQSGDVFAPPLGLKGRGEEHWIFCTDFDYDHGAEYRVDSRLLILHCGQELSDHEYDVHYFLWENNRFRELLSKAGNKPKTGTAR